jgi:tRNA (guanine-N7-)-methyltransferase
MASSSDPLPAVRFRRENLPWLISFGRTKGRVLTPAQQERVAAMLPQLQIHLPEGAEQAKCLGLNPADFFDAAYSSYRLEIGFGGGEHLAGQAAKHPDTGFIGCEPYLNGIVGLIQHIERDKLQNIRLFGYDGRLVMHHLIPSCLSRVDILFPDPWPKLRHKKRRIVNHQTLTMIARVLKPGGLLRLATDHEDYARWMLEYCLAHPDFEWQARHKSDWQQEPLDWVPTRYQQRAVAEGRNAVFFNFLRRS